VKTFGSDRCPFLRLAGGRRPDPVVAAGGSETDLARDDYRSKTAESPAMGRFAPIAGVGAEAAVAVRRDPYRETTPGWSRTTGSSWSG
jgi:hypothetical protein